MADKKSLADMADDVYMDGFQHGAAVMYSLLDSILGFSASPRLSEKQREGLTMLVNEMLLLTKEQRRQETEH